MTGTVPLINSVADLAASDPASAPIVFLSAKGREGFFRWDSADLSGVIGRSLVTTVNDFSDTLQVGWAVASSTNGQTISVAGGHPFVEDQEITTLSSVNGCIAYGRYFACNVTPTTFKVRTSLVATPITFTGSLNATWCGLHGIATGEAIVTDVGGFGLDAGRIYYARRMAPYSIWVAPTYRDAFLGTNLINLTGAGTLLLRVLHDPLCGRFVVPAGFPSNGSGGAYTRLENFVSGSHCGAGGAGLTDDGQALQASVWLGGRLRLPVLERAGLFCTSTPIKWETRSWLKSPNQSVPYGEMEAPDNGLVWKGAEQELTVIRKMSNFPIAEYLISFDGNPDGISQRVAMLPMGQGKNIWSGMQLYGKGRYGSEDDKLVFVRGVWAQEWRNIDMREAAGDFITVGTGAPAGPPAYDEVDNTACWLIEGCRLLEGGGSALNAHACRVAGLVMRYTQIRGFTDWGINATLAYSKITDNCVFERCGNRSDPTTGAIRVTDSVSGAFARTVAITDNIFENNFNHDIDMLMCRGATIRGNSFHTMLPTGGVVANKASIKLRATTATSTGAISVENNRWTDYNVTEDTGIKYDVPNISISASVKGVTVKDNVRDGSATHVLVASPDNLHLINVPTNYLVTRTGAAPVASFRNYAPLP